MKHSGKKTVYIAFLLLIGIFPVFSAPPRVAVYQLQASAMNEKTVKTVDNLVFSFIKELKSYTILDLRTQPVPVEFPEELGIDFIFFGALQELPEGIKLELILKGKEEQVTRIISKVYENINRILLDSRLLVLNLFDFSVRLENLANISPQEQKAAEVEDI